MLKRSDLKDWKRYGKKRTFFGKVKFFLENAHWRVYSLVNGVKNTWQWLPIIHSDRDDSEWFLLRVMHFKLGRMVELHEQNRMYGNETVYEEIKETYEALGRLVADEYEKVYMDKVVEKYGKLELFNQGYRLEFSRNGIETDEDLETCIRLEKEAYLKSEEDRNNDLKILSKNMLKIDGWWL